MNKKGVAPLVLIFIGLAIVVYLKMTGHTIFGEDWKNDVVPHKISELPELNLDDVDSYEKYKTFADSINSLIYITNENLDIEIPKLKTTQEAWDKASKIINKYGPLINNYNQVILSSKDFVKNPSKESYELMYKELGIFSLEFTFISATLFHTAVFKTVGTFYRASGLSTFAVKCPSCVSTILSSSYWAIKTALVEKASEGADYIFNQLGELSQ